MPSRWKTGSRERPNWVKQPKRKKYIAASAASRLERDFPASPIEAAVLRRPGLTGTTCRKSWPDTAGRPDQFSVTASWASILPQLGQIQLAKTTFLRAADQAASAKEQDAQASALLSAAVRRLDGRSMLRSGAGRQTGPAIG